MSIPGEDEGNKGSFVRFISHPMVVTLGLIGAVASIISIPLAVYFFLLGNRMRELTYYVHPVKAVVVKTGEASRLAVMYDGKEIKTDVVAVQVALWNQGRETIRKSHVLRPLVINTVAPILEAVVRKETRQGIVGIKLDESEGGSGRLGVSWDILETDDGGVIQLILAGKTDTKVTAAAVIEGQKEIRGQLFAEPYNHQPSSTALLGGSS